MWHSLIARKSDQNRGRNSWLVLQPNFYDGRDSCRFRLTNRWHRDDMECLKIVINGESVISTIFRWYVNKFKIWSQNSDLSPCDAWPRPTMVRGTNGNQIRQFPYSYLLFRAEQRLLSQIVFERTNPRTLILLKNMTIKLSLVRGETVLLSGGSITDDNPFFAGEQGLDRPCMINKTSSCVTNSYSSHHSWPDLHLNNTFWVTRGSLGNPKCSGCLMPGVEEPY